MIEQERLVVNQDAITCRVLSSDSHVVEPPNLWIERMDRRFGDRIPHLVVGRDYDQWLVDLTGTGTLGGVSGAGLRFEQPESVRLEGKFSEVPKGGYDPDQHVNDMDLERIDVNVLYPSIGLTLFQVPDQELLRAIFVAYNDWLSEFCKTHARRLKGVAMILLDDDVEAGIDELMRARLLGLSGAMISVYPSAGQAYDNPRYERFWAAVQDLQMPLSLHISTNRPGSLQIVTDGKITQTAHDLACVDSWTRLSLCHIVYSGVLERYPQIKLVLVEHDLAWVPHFIDRMDFVYRDFPPLCPYRFKEQMLPSDFMRRNVFHSFQEDALGIRLRDEIGVDNLMWGTDYPHVESTFPRSRQILARILEGVSDGDVAKIVGENTARVYDLN
jgi:predicted TIM-barrel fold metal-dependent hydrolase